MGNVVTTGRTEQGLSVVIPVYNAEPNLAELARQLVAELEKLGLGFEVILVDDGSSDASWHEIETICAADGRFRGIKLGRNYGQHNALLCGIRAAGRALIVTMDDDLQHPPSQIATLLTALEQGYDVVYGVPDRRHNGLWRGLATALTKLALRSAVGARNAHNVSAFRVFRTRLRESFAAYRSPFVSIDVLLSWGTSDFGAVVVRHDQRQRGVSNYTFGKLATHAFNLMTGYSTKPLQLASIIGFGLTLFGIFILIYVLGRLAITGDSVPGFPFLASIISIFSGAQLFALGIIGEYLARMHFRTMDRPAYVVARALDGSEPAPAAGIDRIPAPAHPAGDAAALSRQ